MSLPRSRRSQPISTEERLSAWRARFDKLLTELLPAEDARPPELHLAMRYASLDGGKRIRPLLVYAAAEYLDMKRDLLDSTAAAVEIIHAYSLIHDDLPAMDDDDLRRGRPSVHKAFSEATAILAGDALQALAFQLLAEDDGLSPAICLQIVRALARACGSMGMAGGQMLDLAAVGKTLDLEALETMHRLKTGALIQLCVTAPAVVAGADMMTQQALATYGECVGLAFQIHDDILDETGESETLGKVSRADRSRNKPTFPSIIGIKASRRRALSLRDTAIHALRVHPGEHAALSYLAAYVVSRDR